MGLLERLLGLVFCIHLVAATAQFADLSQWSGGFPSAARHESTTMSSLYQWSSNLPVSLLKAPVRTPPLSLPALLAPGQAPERVPAPAFPLPPCLSEGAFPSSDMRYVVRCSYGQGDSSNQLLPEVLSCPQGLFYHRFTGLCVAPGASAPQLPQEEEEEAGHQHHRQQHDNLVLTDGTKMSVRQEEGCQSAGRFAHPGERTYYLECRELDGAGLLLGLYRCPPGYVFASEHAMCKSASRVFEADHADNYTHWMYLFHNASAVGPTLDVYGRTFDVSAGLPLAVSPSQDCVPGLSPNDRCDRLYHYCTYRPQLGYNLRLTFVCPRNFLYRADLGRCQLRSQGEDSNTTVDFQPLDTIRVPETQLVGLPMQVWAAPFEAPPPCVREGRFGLPHDLTAYYSCRPDLTQVVFLCPPSRFFHQDSGLCVEDPFSSGRFLGGRYGVGTQVPLSAATPSQPCTREGVFPLAGRFYFTCQLREDEAYPTTHRLLQVAFACPEGLTFYADSHLCLKDIWQADWVGGMVTTGLEIPVTLTPHDTPVCSALGNYRLYQSANYYYRCLPDPSGLGFLQVSFLCPPGFPFSPKRGLCASEDMSSVDLSTVDQKAVLVPPPPQTPNPIQEDVVTSVFPMAPRPAEGPAVSAQNTTTSGTVIVNTFEKQLQYVLQHLMAAPIELQRTRNDSGSHPQDIEGTDGSQVQITQEDHTLQTRPESPNEIQMTGAAEGKLAEAPEVPQFKEEEETPLVKEVFLQVKGEGEIPSFHPSERNEVQDHPMQKEISHLEPKLQLPAIHKKISQLEPEVKVTPTKPEEVPQKEEEFGVPQMKGEVGISQVRQELEAPALQKVVDINMFQQLADKEVEVSQGVDQKIALMKKEFEDTRLKLDTKIPQIKHELEESQTTSQEKGIEQMKDMEEIKPPQMQALPVKEEIKIQKLQDKLDISKIKEEMKIAQLKEFQMTQQKEVMTPQIQKITQEELKTPELNAEVLIRKVTKEFEFPDIKKEANATPLNKLDISQFTEEINITQEKGENGLPKLTEEIKIQLEGQDQIPEITIQAEKIDFPQVAIEGEKVELPKITVEAEKIALPEIALEVDKIEIPTEEENVTLIELKERLHIPARDNKTPEIQSEGSEIPRLVEEKASPPATEISEASHLPKNVAAEATMFILKELEDDVAIPHVTPNPTLEAATTSTAATSAASDSKPSDSTASDSTASTSTTPASTASGLTASASTTSPSTAFASVDSASTASSSTASNSTASSSIASSSTESDSTSSASKAPASEDLPPEPELENKSDPQLDETVCTSEGLFPHPTNCSYYYQCIAKNSTFEATLFQCPSIYFFDGPRGTCVPKKADSGQVASSERLVVSPQVDLDLLSVCQKEGFFPLPNQEDYYLCTMTPFGMELTVFNCPKVLQDGEQHDCHVQVFPRRAHLFGFKKVLDAMRVIVAEGSNTQPSKEGQQ